MFDSGMGKSWETANKIMFVLSFIICIAAFIIEAIQ